MQKRRLFSRRINTTQLLHHRSLFDVEAMLRNRLQTASPFMRRLEQEALLSGHEGCVNGLEWSSSGRLLASVSDDCHLMIWDPFRHRRLNDVRTAHQGNIFAVKFLPQSGDRRVVTGAADRKVLVHDVERSEELWKCVCHQTRVKSLAVAPDNPDMLWTSAEDGMICQFDLREPHVCRQGEHVMLINLNNHAGPRSEVKSIAINPRRPEMLGVGANDPYARIFDRRKISVHPMKFPTSLSFLLFSGSTLTTGEDNVPEKCATYYCPGQFSGQEERTAVLHKAITYVTFSPDGNELLVNMGAEQIYLYDLNARRRTKLLNLPAAAEEDADDSMDCRTDVSTSSLSSVAEQHKLLGNGYLKEDKFLKAIDEYNAGIRAAPGNAVLYLNRATAYMRRKWYGDMYAALRDCQTALRLDPRYVKAHFRWARALLELRHTGEAAKCLDELQSRFPEMRQNNGVLALRHDIDQALEADRQTEQPRDKDLSNKELVWRVFANDYEERFVGHCNTTTDIKQANFFGASANYIVAGSDDGNFFIWDRSENRITNIFKGDNAIVNCVQPHPSVCMLATSGIDDTIRLWSPQSVSKEQRQRQQRANGGGPGEDDDDTGDHRVKTVDGAVLSNQQRMQADPYDLNIARVLFFN